MNLHDIGAGSITMSTFGTLASVDPLLADYTVQNLPWTTLGIAALAGAWLGWRRGGKDLAGKVVLINGASRGLGLLIARELAGSGARMIIWARDASQLEIARQDLERRG